MSSILSKLVNLGGNITGTLPIANGGTGQVTAGAALTALGGLTSTLASANLFVGNVSNVATAAAVTGDVSLDNTGFMTPTAAIVATDADATLTSTSVRTRLYTGLTVSRAVTLPTTGIVAGDRFLIANSTAFDLVLKASGGSAFTTANSANIDGTTQKGFVLVMALQATPTTPAHWRVLQVEEDSTFLASFTGAFTANNQTIKYHRVNNLLTLDWPNIQGSASAASLTSGAGAIPVRLRPTTVNMYFLCLTISAGTDQTVPGLFVINTSSMNFYLNGASANFISGTSGPYASSCVYTC